VWRPPEGYGLGFEACGYVAVETSRGRIRHDLAALGKAQVREAVCAGNEENAFGIRVRTA
jgi:hypothetical protein